MNVALNDALHQRYWKLNLANTAGFSRSWV